MFCSSQESPSPSSVYLSRCSMGILPFLRQSQVGWVYCSGNSGVFCISFHCSSLVDPTVNVLSLVDFVLFCFPSTCKPHSCFESHTLFNKTYSDAMHELECDLYQWKEFWITGSNILRKENRHPSFFFFKCKPFPIKSSQSLMEFFKWEPERLENSPCPVYDLLFPEPDWRCRWRLRILTGNGHGCSGQSVNTDQMSV